MNRFAVSHHAFLRWGERFPPTAGSIFAAVRRSRPLTSKDVSGPAEQQHIDDVTGAVFTIKHGNKKYPGRRLHPVVVTVQTLEQLRERAEKCRKNRSK